MSLRTTLVAWFDALVVYVWAHDYFISYARRDGSEYALQLADRIVARDRTCKLDQWETTTGKDNPVSLVNAARRASVFIIVGTPGARGRPAIVQELSAFAATKKQIVPIDIGGGLVDVQATPSAGETYVYRPEWDSFLRGRPPSFEASGAVTPSSATIGRVFAALTVQRQALRIKRGVASAASVLVILVLALAFVAQRASQAVDEQKVAKAEAIKAIQEQKVAEKTATLATENATKALADSKAQARKAQDATLDAFVRLKETRAQEVASLASTLGRDDPELGLILALEASNNSRNAEVVTVLREAIQRQRIVARLGPHDGKVVRAVLSRDNKRLITATSSGTAYIWDVATRRVIRQIPIKASVPESPLGEIALSADGRFFAYAYGGNLLTIARVDGSGQPARLSQPDGIASVRFHPHRNALVATLTRDIIYWRLDPTANVDRWLSTTIPNDGFSSAAFDSTGERLMVVAERQEEGSLAQRRAQSRSKTAVFKEFAVDASGAVEVKPKHRIDHSSLKQMEIGDVSPNGNFVVGVGGSDAQVVDLVGGLAIPLAESASSGGTEQSRTSSASNAVFVNDATILVERQGFLEEWKAKPCPADAAECQRTSTFLSMAVERRAPSALWSVSRIIRTEPRSYGQARDAYRFSLNTRQNLAAVGSDANIATIIDLEAGLPVDALTPQRGAIGSIVLSTDGNVLVIGSNDGFASIWRIPQVPSRIENAKFPVRHRTPGLPYLSPSGKVVMSDARYLFVADPATARDTDVWHVVNDVTFNAKESVAVVTSQDKVIRFVDLASGRTTNEVRDEAPGSACLDIDGRSLFIASKYKSTRRDISRAESRAAVPAQYEQSIVVRCSPTRSQVAFVTGNGEIFLWNVADGMRAVRRLGKIDFGASRGIGTLHHALLFTSDGDRVMFFDSSGIARTWDTANGDLLPEVRVHPGGVRSVMISPASGMVLSLGDDDRTIMMREANGSRPFFRLTLRDAYAGAAALSSDDRHITVFGKSIAIYDCDACGPIERVRQMARDRVTRTLSAAEKATYLGPLEEANRQLESSRATLSAERAASDVSNGRI